ncbi:hypothetical protein C3747_23g110 [Trypanosoma cruzi]|uniref:Uncharacterized protein n=2 Tax=Trypanosoma cruzi TaxID=5693 RepID=Q4E1L3_TRYCC|nr:hypothetical protein, conserved [Trypanosoma cruzi]EAN98659.1 hypothetical protein, conserved [Trypanosoma cruzi]PWV16453.1 hypothetical protein C3747_23g110 [Trypanosoma cruzi]|eukprot:XP_820510.1 hypothetical protein [Trypanosoma cruzi strain CL Brener]
MDGEEADVTKETKEGGPNTSHTFSVDAAPFEPSVNVSSNLANGWQDASSALTEQLSALGANESWPYPAQYIDMFALNASMRAMVEAAAMMNVGAKRYSGAPIVKTTSPPKKGSNASEASRKREKGSLSIHAKPWSPSPETGLNQKEGDTYTHLKKGWVKVPYRGEMVIAPVAFKEIANDFVHSLTVRPIEKPRIHLELYNYHCARCATHSFFGRLSCRDADVILKGIAGDIPPLCVAHLIEQVTGAVVCALFTKGDCLDYEIWLETPDKAAHFAKTISDAMWTCPMFHGYAVHTKTEEEKAFLHEYISSLKDDFPEETPYPMRCVEAIASSTGKVKG